MITKTVLTNLNFPKLNLLKEGKVRSVYDLGDQLLFVASDRVSAFDVILPQGIPHKGEILTRLSEFWFNQTTDIIGNHFVTSDVNLYPEVCKEYADDLAGRSMLVKKAELLPVECVVRGYIIGSGWKDYQQTGAICGIELPEGLNLADKLEQPIFTPAFKAEMGDHDENISFERMIEIVGAEKANYMKDISMKMYEYGRDFAATKGIILADTKFEFGLVGDDIILIDEVLTPDSSRYWPKEDYQPGISPPSFDKQIVRDYLAGLTWDKNPPAPNIPNEVIDRVSKRYQEVYNILQ
ncbi:MAG: phosphoribosylaminoimidazolesuccinocarboxamide synthase [Rickettsiales bacterium]|nr:phosphoribosylaminoimidazolesuccinocarboxamide synthase [Rickettsiales bacterium]